MRCLACVLTLLTVLTTYATAIRADDFSAYAGFDGHAAWTRGSAGGPHGRVESRADHHAGFARTTSLDGSGGTAVGYAVRLPDGRYIAGGHHLRIGPHQSFYGSGLSSGGRSAWFGTHSPHAGAGSVHAGALQSPRHPARTSTFARSSR